jgi:hypothetical protein
MLHLNAAFFGGIVPNIVVPPRVVLSNVTAPYHLPRAVVFFGPNSIWNIWARKVETFMRYNKNPAVWKSKVPQTFEQWFVVTLSFISKAGSQLCWPRAGACIIKLIAAVIYGFCNKLKCLSLNNRLVWKCSPGTNTLAYYGNRKLRP